MKNQEAEIFIDEQLLSAVERTQGSFFESISGIDRKKTASDILDPKRSRQQAELVEQYENLSEKKVLEVGSGAGLSVTLWSKEFGAEMYGIEPCGEGFDESLKIAHRLLKNNGLPLWRIIAGFGEKIPFSNDSFDIVYSLNVLEHTDNPARVLQESFRVLRPGGLLYFTFPNYMSFYEGHYAVFTPPIFFSALLPWYVKHVCRRDPAFAKTIRSELNVGWVIRTLEIMKKNYSLEVVSLGEHLFKERMKSAQVETWAGLGKVLSLVKLAAALKLNTLAAKLLVSLRLWTPIVLIVRKKG
ncbi:MAG: class I SAM-dependent methyltransferase [Chitinispirillaceae bacterium]